MYSRPVGHLFLFDTRSLVGSVSSPFSEALASFTTHVVTFIRLYGDTSIRLYVKIY